MFLRIPRRFLGAPANLREGSIIALFPLSWALVISMMRVRSSDVEI